MRVEGTARRGRPPKSVVSGAQVVERTTVTETLTPATPPEKGPAVRESSDPEHYLEGLTRDQWCEGRAFYLLRVSDTLEVTEKRQGPYYGAFLARITNAPIIDPETQESHPEVSFKDFKDDNFWFGLQEWTKRHYGGGTFAIKVNPTKLGGGTEFYKQFALPGLPIVSRRESLKPGAVAEAAASESQRIMEYLKKRDLEIEKLNVELAKAKEQAGNPQAVQKTIDMVTNTYESLMQRLAVKPSETDDLIKQALGQVLMKALNPATPALSSIDLARELAAQLAPLVKREDGDDITKRVEAARMMFTTLGIKVGGAVIGGGGATVDWTQIITQALPQVGKLIDLGVAAVRRRWFDKPNAADQAVAREAGAGPVLAGEPAVAAPVLNPDGTPRRNPDGSIMMAIGGQTLPPTGVPQVAAAMPAFSNVPSNGHARGIATLTQDELKQLHDSFAWRDVCEEIIDWFRHNETGANVAYFLNIRPRWAQFVSMISNASRDEAIGFIKSDQYLRAIGDDPRLPAFIEDFLNAFKQARAAGPQPVA
jgi:hypothetical protein